MSQKNLQAQGKTFTVREHDGFGKVFLTFELVDEILWCDHLNETSVSASGTMCLVCSSKF